MALLSYDDDMIIISSSYLSSAIIIKFVTQLLLSHKLDYIMLCCGVTTYFVYNLELTHTLVHTTSDCLINL